MVPWATLGASLALSLTAVVMAAHLQETSSGAYGWGHVVIVPMIGFLGVLTTALFFALTRSQRAIRRAARAGAVALERGEALRAHLEQQGRTARREAQERLALIDALFRATPAGLAVFDRELRFVRVNHGLCDLHGIPAGAHLGRRLSQLLPDLQAAEEELRKVLDSGEARTVELTGRTPAYAEPRTWLCNFAPVRNEESEVVGVAAVMLDISARKHAEREARALFEALRAEREVFSVLHRVGQQIAAELNLERLVQVVADAAARVTHAELALFVYSSEGRKPAHALSGSAHALAETCDFDALLTAVEDIPPEGVRVADALEEGVPGELRGIFADAAPVRSLLAFPVLTARRTLRAVLLVADTQAFKFSVRDANVLAGLSTQASIALENARLYGEAEGLIRALAQSNRALDQFAYVTSHDLKAPLRGIATIANWLEEDLGDDLPRHAREHLKLLRSRVVRLENMVGGILRYSRAGRFDEDPERVDVNELVREVVALLSPGEGATVRIAPNLPVLLTARVPLQQVFMNLIDNALKYARREDVIIDIDAREIEGGWFQFSVRDNGQGIDAEDRERIWQLFQSRASDGESSGIGLAVVRKTVEARGGRAWVESELGHGATFYFTWPRGGAA
jgi:PAS domain S-box-containing protein